MGEHILRILRRGPKIVNFAKVALNFFSNVSLTTGIIPKLNGQKSILKDIGSRIRLNFDITYEKIVKHATS